MINETTIDYRPLTQPIDRAAFQAFKAQAKADSGSWGSAIFGIVLAACGTIFALVIVLFFVIPIVAGLVPNAVAGSTIALIVMVGVVCLFGTLILMAIRYATGPNGPRGRWYRLSQFANANGFVPCPPSVGPGYPGSIFSIGSSRRSYDRIQSASGRFLDIGNYRYTTGSGKNRQTHTWGFMALQLDRRLPHMVLDARSNNGLFGGTNLPSQFSKDQILTLEGNFNEYFTLFCPREYERDALYVFTPDLMALLVDQTSSFDVEIVDDWMFVYSAQPLPVLNPMMWQRMFRIVNTVGAKTLDQTEHYRDERMVPTDLSVLAGAATTGNLIATQGQRLKKRINWVAIVIIAGVVIVWLWTIVGTLGSGN